MATGYPPQHPRYPHAGQFPQGQPAPGVQPSAATLDKIAGYENTIGSDSVPVGPPPPYQPPDQPKERPVERFDQKAAITGSQAKQALIEFVGQNYCFGKKPAEAVNIQDQNPSSAYHYVLETYHEIRKTNWHQEPYKGQPIDGPMNGPAPGPWDIFVQIPAYFQPQESHVEVPHTATVKACPNCFGSGSRLCNDCKGKGAVKCPCCHGHGHEVHRPATATEPEHYECCPVCRGDGDKTCKKCHGNRRVECPTCDGHCQVKAYIRLTVTWKVKKDVHIVEKTALPDELISQVSGTTIFSQEYPMVYPLTSFFDQDVNQASQRLVNNHGQLGNTARIHRQRHHLRAVPVNEVTGSWKETQYRFWVYGLEHKVHCPDYPQQCCCGCTII